MSYHKTIAIPKQAVSDSFRKFDLQGHRGARGLRPENTLAAFAHALELGVDTLELDVVISSDGHVVVSHDPVMSPVICSAPDGGAVQGEIRIYGLTAAEIALYDCGSRPHPGFPEQVRSTQRKPLLREVVALEADHCLQTGRARAFWNIETKSTPEGDGIDHPEPEEFVRLLYEELLAGGIKDRTTVQSFDVRTLQVFKALDPELRLSLLRESSDASDVQGNLELLGFIPHVYSPDHEGVTPALVAEIHEAGMMALPWTVNEVARMRELLAMGVDGFITDYPDRALGLRAG